jgi:O-antigen/teichoic acid export membrane protein
MNSSKKFIYDVGITIVSSSANTVLGFAVMVVLARNLGVEDLGVYRLMSAVYSMVLVVAVLGVPTTITKYVAETRGKKDQMATHISASLTISLVLGAAATAISFMTADIVSNAFHESNMSGLLKLLSFIYPFSISSATLLGVLNGLREMKFYGLAVVAQSCVMLTVSISTILAGFGLWGVILGMLLSSMATFVLLLWKVRGIARIALGFRRDVMRRILDFGWKITAINGVYQINYQVDSLLLGYFLTATDVGFYGVAIGLSRILLLAPSAVQTISYPLTSELWSKDERRALQTVMDRCLKYSAAVIYPAAMVAGLFAGDIIRLLFGGAFLDSVAPFRILLVGTAIYGVATSVGGTLTGIGRPDLALLVGAATATIDVVLNLILIPVSGVVGAALATSSAFAAGAALMLISIKRTAGLEVNVKWHITIAASFVCILGLPGVIGDQSLMVNSSLVVFFTVLVVGVFLDPDDRRYILDAARRK